ncbi:hypothetical protein BIW11_11668 [Tropilaelaps mercedesae]|uniref:Uncharacterized protein n=1 Tax=Tropilaelaps mercedesae TaxID=418985 RepID=A0A1V9XAF8_9ACAR|nr:hypothetical protein BIW11_11668 [Tropilaelaps mercedesae]
MWRIVRIAVTRKFPDDEDGDQEDLDDANPLYKPADGQTGHARYGAPPQEAGQAPDVQRSTMPSQNADEGLRRRNHCKSSPFVEAAGNATGESNKTKKADVAAARLRDALDNRDGDDREEQRQAVPVE